MIWGRRQPCAQKHIYIISLAAITLFSSCNQGGTSGHDAAPFVHHQTPYDTGHTVPAADVPIGSSPRFQHLGVNDGLSQNTVFCIQQDSRGFLWFGTEYGLNRYDGYEFSVYQNDPNQPKSIGDSWITSIANGNDGTLWIGTLSGGLCGYDWRTDEFTCLDGDEIGEINTMLVDHDGHVWIGTNRGLSRYNPDSGEFSRYPIGDQTDEVLSLWEDRNNRIWAGTHDGFIARVGENEVSSVVRIRVGSELNEIRAIVGDEGGILWLGTDDGLYVLPGDLSIREPQRIDGPYRNIRMLRFHGDETLLIGTRTGGLYIADTDGDLLHHIVHDAADPTSLSSNAVESIFLDREGTIWIGTLPGGINKLTADRRTFLHIIRSPGKADSLSDNWIRSIAEDDDGVLWIGTGTSGLDRYNPNSGDWKNYRHNSSDPQSLAADHVSFVSIAPWGDVFVPNASGLDILDPKEAIFTHYVHDPDDPQSLADSDGASAAFVDSYGEVWVATLDGGLCNFNVEDGTFIRYQHDPLDHTSIAHNSIWNIFEDSNRELWLGTTNGLDRLNRSDNSFIHYPAEPGNQGSLSNGFIGPMAEDSLGRLWVGTIGGGINRLDPMSDTFTLLATDDGLPDNAIMSMVFDEMGNLWVGTSSGLARIDPSTLEIVPFTSHDGVPLAEFNGGAVHALSNGNLIFGGIDGLMEFNPRHIQKNTVIPPVIVTRVSQGGKALNIDSHQGQPSVTIRWPDNGFEFQASSLSFTSPQQNRYAYILEGLDTEWTQSEEFRVGRYRRLPGGSYTLRVIASNDDGIWNTEGVELGVTVIPPFWATWWFRAGAFVVVLGIGASVYFMRIRNVAQKTRMLEAIVAERTSALEKEIEQRLAAEEALHSAEMKAAVDTERGRLARDLHDSVTQSLYSLTLFIEATKQASDAGDVVHARHGLERSGVTALQALKELRLLVYELRPLALREMGLAGALQDRLDAVEKRTQMQTDLLIDMDPDANLSNDLEEALFRICQEALNNSLKHSQASSITVRLEAQKNGHIELEVADNGVGFSESDAEQGGGMGLESIRERARHIGASCSVFTEKNVGTRISILKEQTHVEG